MDGRVTVFGAAAALDAGDPEFMAQMIGVQRHADSVVAHAPQQARTVRYSRGHLEITDLAALRATSCGCRRSRRTQYA
jgi:hypothetical protein